MQSVWQISIRQLLLLMAVAAIYLAVRSQPIHIPHAFFIMGIGYNAGATAAFFLFDQPASWNAMDWGQALRNIAIGTLFGGVIGLDITETLRGMEYWVWSEDWIYFAGWMVVQLIIAGFTYVLCRGAFMAYCSGVKRAGSD